MLIAVHTFVVGRKLNYRRIRPPTIMVVDPSAK